MTSLAIKRYAVIGNPIEHSRSPFIHHAFAQQCGIELVYEKRLAPLDGFNESVKQFFAEGGLGLNVTVPFKEEAYQLARQHLSPRAELAAAVNTLWVDEHGIIHGCNSDGMGLLNDLHRLGHAPQGKRVLMVGAGGAARGCLLPLLESGCSELRVINRTAQRAQALVSELLITRPEYQAQLNAGALQDINDGEWDIVINATSASLSSQAPQLDGLAFSAQSLAYDMVYGTQATAFMLQSQQQGASQQADGLGMLVGQAAISFQIWHGVLPETTAVLHDLRQALKKGS